MAMELPSSSWIKSIHASCSQCQHIQSEDDVWWETHTYASATLMQSLLNIKNVSMMAQKSIQHMSATQQRMIPRFTVADDLKASSKITSQRTISEDHQRIKVKPPWRIKDNELTKSKNAKDERTQEVKRLPRQRQLFIRLLDFIGDLA